MKKMENIRVYKMDDYTWWASKTSKEEARDCYMEEYRRLKEEDVPIGGIRECNLDTEGMWWETRDDKDLERLGDADEIVGFEIVKGQTKRKIQFGNLLRDGDRIFKFISFREALQKHGDFTEPFCLASTEW
jgi:hypothetical protein